ncbi:hypothetical protein [Methanosarcina mazei]|uniref:Uncharacterized protein n=1 Tax=Methanosarcina mazei TaxID=2209 RepID=A0A0F8LMT6_METMZ|nr:hypothetical protein [Methanosarcina mazei]KKG94570.1 hypothetical protein DU69_13895 [Methanosarcina mazei]
MTKRNNKTECEKGIVIAFGRLIESLGGIVISCGVFLKNLGSLVMSLENLKPYLVGITALVMLLLRIT